MQRLAGISIFKAIDAGGGAAGYRKPLASDMDSEPLRGAMRPPKKKQVHYQDEVDPRGSINIKTWEDSDN